MKKYTILLFSFLFLLIVKSNAQSTKMYLPAHSFTYTASSIGYYFQAPVNFKITKLRVPTNSSSSNQSIQVIRCAEPPTMADYNPTTRFTSLGYWQLSSADTIFPNIQVKKGEWIVIIGMRGTNATSLSAYEYTPLANTIMGFDMEMFETDLQYSSYISSGPATSLYTYNPSWGQNIARTDLWYSPSGTNNYSLLDFASLNVCNTTQDIKVNLQNANTKKLDSCVLKWSINGTLQTPINYNKNPSYSNSDTIGVGKIKAITLKTGQTLVPTTNYIFKAWIENPNGMADGYSADDTITYNFFFAGNSLAPTAVNATRCGVGTVPLSVTPNNNSDSIYWFKTNTSNSLLHSGKWFNTPFLYKTDTFYAEARRSSKINLNFTNFYNGYYVITGSSSEYNGAYLDLVSKDRQLIIDSIAFHVYDSTSSINDLVAYTRLGTSYGYERSRSGWNLLDSGASRVFSTETGAYSLMITPNAPILMPPNTTIGLYYSTDPSLNRGNDLHIKEGYDYKENNELSIEGLSVGYGLFGTKGVFNDYCGDIKVFYRVACDASPRTKVVATIKYKPYGSRIIKGSVFNGFFNTGNMVNPDVVAETKNINYEFTAPTGFTNGGHNTTWRINSVTLKTINGTTVPTAMYSTSNPGSSNAMLSFTPANGWADTTIKVEYSILNIGNGCDSLITRYIFVAPTPKPKFSFTNVCLGNSTEFTNLSEISSGLMTYKWYFGNGDSSEILSPIYTYNNFGKYQVRLIAKSNLGITKDTTIQVEVFEIPSVKFKITNNCEGTNIVFTNNTTISSGTLAYNWKFGDGATSTLASPTHLYSIPGGYNVTLVASANGCSNSLTKIANQFARPTAAFSNTGSCAFSNVMFINQSTIELNETFGSKWTFGDGGTNNETNPNHIYLSAGNKTVKLLVTSQFGCKDSLSKDINITLAPNASFTIDKACDIDPVKFNNTTIEPSGLITNYIWDFGDAATSTQKNPEHVYGSVGVRRVTLTATSNNGCKTTISKDLDIKLQPVANFEVDNVCQGENAIFINKTTSNGGDIKFTWLFGDGSQTNDLSPIKIYSPTVATTYNVTLKAEIENGCTDEIIKSITVAPTPSCGYTYESAKTGGYEFIFTPNVSTYSKYDWVFKGNSYSNETAPKVKFVQDGFYKVIVTMTTNEGCQCIDSSKTIAIGKINGIKNSNIQDIVFYPNPTSSKVNFKLNGVTIGQNLTINVMDLTGKVVLNSSVVNSGKNIELNVDHLAAGSYYVQVNGEKIALHGKFSIVK